VQALVNVVLVLVQVMFASMAIAGKLVLPEIPPRGLVVIRVSAAFTIMILAYMITGRGKVRSGRDWVMLAIVGLLGVTANQNMFLMGLERTTAINASILVTTVPIFTVLYSVLSRQESASASKIGGIALAGLGVVYLIGPDRVSLAPNLALGNGLVVMAMACYAGFLVLSKPLLRRYDTLTVIVWAMFFGLLGTLPVGLATLSRVSPTEVPIGIWAVVGYIILVPTIGAFFLSAWALKRSSSQLVAAYIYLQPLVTASIAPAILEGERITSRMMVAGLAIFAGLGLVIWGEIGGGSRGREGSGASG
jgi:drug/metabolite transporter (DMT)-like permease